MQDNPFRPSNMNELRTPIQPMSMQNIDINDSVVINEDRTGEDYHSKNFIRKIHFLQKCYQNLERNVRPCNKFAKYAILVQTCGILLRNAKLARIAEEFRKICDSCNLGISRASVKSGESIAH